VSMELNDVGLPGTLDHNPSARRFCGEGDYDLVGFIRSVRDTGFCGPWVVEVINPDYARLPLEQMAGKSYRSTAEALKRARRILIRAQGLSAGRSTASRYSLGVMPVSFTNTFVKCVTLVNPICSATSYTRARWSRSSSLARSIRAR